MSKRGSKSSSGSSVKDEVQTPGQSQNNQGVWALYNKLVGEDGQDNPAYVPDEAPKQETPSQDDKPKSSKAEDAVMKNEDLWALHNSMTNNEDNQDQGPSHVADEKIEEPPPPHYSSVPPLSTSADIKDAEKGDAETVQVVNNGAPVPAEGVEEEEGGRDIWDSQLEFLLSCISMSVGLGNVWRFPFTAYENGGGAFLIPYLIVLMFIGRPIYYLEMCLGQFTSFGQTKIWALAPLFKGVAYGSTLGVICVVSYYCSLMALTTFYFFASFAKTVPWADCKEKWNGWEYTNNGSLEYKTYCAPNGSYIGGGENSMSQLYYEKEVFPQKTNISEGLGYPEWRLTLCLAFSWLAILLSLIKGVKSSGKVAYFTAIFPYIVLFILLIRGVTLPGAWDGIEYFITPQWDKILEPDVWFAAVGQCFFSLSTGFGPIIMFSSYNPFRHNVNRDALIISLMDTFTSVLAGVTIFSVLGNLAYESTEARKDIDGIKVNITDVAKGGPGLAFISYPEAIAKFDVVPQLFAVLFFLMLFTLGVGSATSLTGGIITIICDQFPKWIRWQVTTAVCIIGFAVGLLYVTPGGQFMLTLVDTFGANFVIYVMAMIEVSAVSYIYGLNNFCRDIEFMLGTKPGWYWKFCWGFFIPVGLFVILIYWAVTNKELTHEGINYPSSAIISGWILAAFCVSMVPLWGLHGILSRKAPTFKEKFIEALRPSKHWGPKYAKERREWIEFKKSY